MRTALKCPLTAIEREWNRNEREVKLWQVSSAAIEAAWIRRSGQCVRGELLACYGFW